MKNEGMAERSAPILDKEKLDHLLNITPVDVERRLLTDE
jgi:hypothetical protein